MLQKYIPLHVRRNSFQEENPGYNNFYIYVRLFNRIENEGKKYFFTKLSDTQETCCKLWEKNTGISMQRPRNDPTKHISVQILIRVGSIVSSVRPI